MMVPPVVVMMVVVVMVRGGRRRSPAVASVRRLGRRPHDKVDDLLVHIVFREFLLITKNPAAVYEPLLVGRNADRTSNSILELLHSDVIWDRESMILCIQCFYR